MTNLVFLFSKAPLAFRNVEIIGEQKLIFFFFIINFHLEHASLACIFRIYGSVAIGSNSETAFSTLFKCSFGTVISLLLYVRWIVYHSCPQRETAAFSTAFQGYFIPVSQHRRSLSRLLKTARNYFLDRFFKTYSVQQFRRKFYIFQVTNM